MAFKYKGRSDESIKRQAEATSGNYDDYIKQGITKYKVRDGENHIRIMPASSCWDNADPPKGWGDHWGIQLFVHGQVGADNASYLCPKRMLGEDCAVCDGRDKMIENGAEKEETDKWRPSQRTGVFLIDRFDEKTGPLFWSMPFTSVAKPINGFSIHRRTGKFLRIDDPEDGYDIFFRKQGTRRNTDYINIEIDRDPTYLCENKKMQKEWLEWLEDHSMPDFLNFYDYKYIEKVAAGSFSRREADRDDDDRGGRGSRGSRSRDRDDDRRGGRDEVEDRRGRSRDDADRGRDRDEPKRGRDRDDDRDDRRSRRGEEDDRTRGPSRDSDEERPSRGRDRGRADDDEEDRSEKGRDRGEKAEERPSRGRGRETEDADDDRSRKRDDEGEDRGSRRSRDRDEKEDGDSRSGRGRDKAEEPEESRGRRGRPEPEADEDPPAKGRRGRQEEDDDDSKDEPKGGGNKRRSSRDADDEVEQARGAIDDMKGRRSRR